MQTSQQNQLSYQIQFPNLPLAVYREIAAHLRQVEGVEIGLLPAPQEQFDYNQSQVGGLWIRYMQTANLQSRQRIDQILDYYQSRYGSLNEINFDLG